jgi:polysaccharide biosynthesis transport protein
VVDIRRSVSALAKRWLIVLGVAVAALVLGVMATWAVSPRYTAVAQAFVSVSDPDKRSPNVLTSGSLYITARMSSYAALATSNRVLEAVAASLHGARSPDALREEVSSTAVVETALIQVRVTDKDPAVAASVANTGVWELSRSIEDLENGTVSVSLSKPATRPMNPVNRRFSVNAAVALAGGLVLGCVIAVLLDLRDARHRRDHQG